MMRSCWALLDTGTRFDLVNNVVDRSEVTIAKKESSPIQVY